MKTPLTYYGGKQQLAPTIVSILPPHRIYVEPFVGGGAVFFSKSASTVEVVNDINCELVNFYQQVKQNFPLLEQEIRISLHSRDLHRRAKVMYENPDLFDPLKRAWAVWVLATQSYGAKLDGSFGYDRSGQTSRKVSNRRASFSEDLAIRLQEVQIECADALRIIRSRDTPESLFYLDPPYFNSDMGHYDGYTIEDFEMLLVALGKLEGKFVLSSYPSTLLKQHAVRNGWLTYEKRMALSMSAATAPRTKVEALTVNFSVDPRLMDGWSLAT